MGETYGLLPEVVGELRGNVLFRKIRSEAKPGQDLPRRVLDSHIRELLQLKELNCKGLLGPHIDGHSNLWLFTQRLEEGGH